MLAWCAATTVLAMVLAVLLPFLSITNLFLVPVIAVSLRLGLVPALAATAIGLLAGMMFYDPMFEIEVREPRDIVDLAVFAAIGVTLSLLGNGLRRTTLALRRRQEHLSSLYALSHDMARAADRPALLAVLAAHLSRTLGHSVTVQDLGAETPGDGASALPEDIRSAVPRSLPATQHETVIVRAGGEVWAVAAIGQADGPALAIAAGDLSIDFAFRRVSLRGEPVTLARKEYQLLAMLAAHRGRVLTHKQLLTALWGPQHEEDVHYVRILVRKLRNRIEPNVASPIYVQTELGVGYRLATGIE